MTDQSCCVTGVLLPNDKPAHTVDTGLYDLQSEHCSAEMHLLIITLLSGLMIRSNVS